MGRFSDWLKRHNIFINPAADLERIEGSIARIAIDAKLLAERPSDAVGMHDIEPLQAEARKFRKNLTTALAINPRYRNLAAHGPAVWRLSAARDALTEAEVRLEALRGRIQAGTAATEAVQAHETERTRKPAYVRWARLDPVKQWAFDQRAARPEGSRAALIREIAPQVRTMAKDAGEPLSGDDQSVIDTVTRWFREAEIK